MGTRLGLIFFVATMLVAAQTPGERELSRAKSHMEELRGQVEAGGVPRARLDEAQEALADASDAGLLSRTLNGGDLTAQKSGEMSAGALRALERRNANA